MKEMMKNTIPDYFSSVDILLIQENEELRSVVDSERNALELQKKAIDILKRELNVKEEELEVQSQTINRLRDQIKEYTNKI